MDIKFKLTIELKTEINDIVEYEGGEDQIRYIQEIIDQAKNNNEFLINYFLHRLCEFNLKSIITPDIIPVIHTYKDYLGLFSNILPKISTEAQNFLEQLFGYPSELKPFNSEEAEKYLRIILAQFKIGKILKIDLKLNDNI